MKQVIIMRAIPGSGKSAYAKQLINKAKLEGLTTETCSADDYFEEVIKKYDPTKVQEAHKYCFRKFINAINSEINLIIVDNTNIFAWEISPYKAYAEIHDYEVSINQIRVDPVDAFKRQQHGVPKEKHDAMSRNINKETLPPRWNKEIIQSKTSESGEPVFEKELARKAYLILEMAEYFYKFANK